MPSLNRDLHLVKGVSASSRPEFRGLIPVDIPRVQAIRPRKILYYRAILEKYGGLGDCTSAVQDF